ncbi:MAG TPA: MarP family serine protease [Solirubrobacteraceae bacterium]|nr:MarP family serine protease [Solirubrobacteraceae bacterium]
MTQLDWIIVGVATLLALFGSRQGFIVGVLSFGGFALGAFLGTRLGPLLLPQGAASPYAPAFGLVGALLAGAVLASGLEGIGLRLRRLLMIPGFGLLDGALGALLSAAVGLGVVWIAAAVAAQAPGAAQLRSDVQRSLILRELNELLPPSGPILNALARLDPLPSIAGPLPALSPPPSSKIARAAGVQRASRSVVRVLGTACGLAIEGSGWVAEPGIVVTNAHVVAGERDTTVQVGGVSPSLPVRTIAFDPTDDVAVLRVPDLGVSALSFAPEPHNGDPGAIVGYPQNGPLDIRPGRIGRTQRVLTKDVYGQRSVQRLLTPLRGVVRPGNSGGPLLDSDGRVLTTVFAGTTGSGPRGGYGVANATVAHVLEHATGPVSTGACTSG